mgnify:CR=1 FL=1
MFVVFWENVDFIVFLGKDTLFCLFLLEKILIEKENEQKKHEKELESVYRVNNELKEGYKRQISEL